jgi:serine/threonine-protein kinase
MVDHRADIYALGCVAYFLLTGTPVFHDANPVTLALKHVQAPPDPPSMRTELPIPKAFEALVLQCLAKKPADRPATAHDVAAAIAACGLPPWTREDADAWWERHLPATSSLRSNATPPAHTPHVVQRV